MFAGTKGYPVSHYAHGQNNKLLLKANETDIKLQSLTIGNNVFTSVAIVLRHLFGSLTAPPPKKIVWCPGKSSQHKSF